MIGVALWIFSVFPVILFVLAVHIFIAFIKLTKLDGVERKGRRRFSKNA